MNNVEFGTDDVSTLLAEMENEGTQYVSQYWNPKKEGNTKIRFLPRLQSFNEKNFYQVHKIHYIGGIPYFCLKQTLKDKNGNIHEAENCPFCQKASQLYSLETPKESPEYKLAGELRAKDRFVSRIIVRGKEDKDGNDIEAIPEFYEFGKKIRDIIKAALEGGEYGNPFDLKAGRDFNLSKHGVKRNTDYSGSNFSVNQSPIFSDPVKLKELLKELPNKDYSQLVEFKPREELAKILKDYLSGSGEEEEVEEKIVVGEKIPKDPLSDDVIFGVPSASEETEAEEDGEDIDALLNGLM